MTVPFLADRDVTIHVGDALDVLRTLPERSVHCCVTSPPFYRLRDYNVDGQIGMEDTPEEWAARLVAVFAECRRVLRDDGTMWVEIGDSYNAGTRARRQSSSDVDVGAWQNGGQHGDERISVASCKPKDLLGQPWMLAFALRADGWYLRQCIVWFKSNCMPESVTDRCTTAHSYVFLLAKRARYYFDAASIAEPAEWARWGDQTAPKYEGTDTAAGWLRPKTKHELMALADHRYDGLVDQKWKKTGRVGNGQRDRSDEMRGFDERRDRADGRKNARSVWTIPTRGYEGAHFATFPEELARRCILAGCPEGGTVLDPFLGSGTTALVARKHGRRAVGIELNPDYAAMAAQRLAQQSLLTEAST